MKRPLPLREDHPVKKPAFDISVEARDIHITQDNPFLSILPIFTTRDGEVGGILQSYGVFARNRWAGNPQQKLVADMKLEQDGYIRGNRLISSILKL